MAQREEESLIDEMREAIRADRDRAAARGAKPAVPADPPAQAPVPSERPKNPLRRLLGL